MVVEPNPVPKFIGKFSGPWNFLSNFYPCRVEHEGIEYPSAEHAYQAAKTLDMGERVKFSVTGLDRLSSPGAAKKQGRNLVLRPDWDSLKLDIMREILRAKFYWRNEALGQKLLKTGRAELEEGNTWGDRYWGRVDGVGMNWLGRILMETRWLLLKKGEPAVRCPIHARVILTPREYDRQMDRPDSLWVCPCCHSNVTWDGTGDYE